MELAIRLDQPPEVYDALMDEAASVASRYQALWEVLHAEPTFSFDDRYQIEGQIRRLHELGFAVDEVSLRPAGDSDERLRLKVAVAARRFHATQLHDLTGLDVGEGQARILLGDLRAYQARHARAGAGDSAIALQWVSEQAGHDVGDMAALEALARRSVPSQSAAEMAIAEATTGQFAALTPQLLASLTTDAETYPEPDEP